MFCSWFRKTAFLFLSVPIQMTTGPWRISWKKKKKWAKKLWCKTRDQRPKDPENTVFNLPFYQWQFRANEIAAQGDEAWDTLTLALNKSKPTRSIVPNIIACEIERWLFPPCFSSTLLDLILQAKSQISQGWNFIIEWILYDSCLEIFPTNSMAIIEFVELARLNWTTSIHWIISIKNSVLFSLQHFISFAKNIFENIFSLRTYFMD